MHRERDNRATMRLLNFLKIFAHVSNCESFDFKGRNANVNETARKKHLTKNTHTTVKLNKTKCRSNEKDRQRKQMYFEKKEQFHTII